MFKTQIMGILNLTPDSFSDGGHFNALDKALEHAIAMSQAGADYIDIGGESTRPGAARISVQEELDRIMPAIKTLRQHAPEIAISVDTSKPEVMQAAIDNGINFINDVNALQADGALETLANSSATVCLMHKQGTPDTMQQAPQYKDVVSEVFTFLKTRRDVCIDAGISQDRIVLDPGFGFGKTLAHNIQLMQALAQFQALACPLLVGVSRKSMIGAILDKPVDQRLNGGLALALLAVQQGAQIIRSHDVAATADVLKIWQAFNNADHHK